MWFQLNTERKADQTVIGEQYCKDKRSDPTL